MTKGPALPGSPCSTAIFAPLGIEGGASVHLMSLGLMKICASLAPCASAGPASTPQAMIARASTRFLSIDVSIVLLLSPKERRHDGAVVKVGIAAPWLAILPARRNTASATRRVP